MQFTVTVADLFVTEVEAGLYVSTNGVTDTEHAAFATPGEANRASASHFFGHLTFAPRNAGVRGSAQPQTHGETEIEYDKR